MVHCPLCNQPMDGIDPDEYGGYADIYICGVCQIGSRPSFWDSGERVVLEKHEDDQE